MSRTFIVLLCALFLPASVHAVASVSFATSPLWLSAARIVVGKSVTISTAVMKVGDEKVTGGVTFYANEKQIGFSDFSLGAHTYGAVASVSWVPAPGTYNISAKITRAVITRDGKEEALVVSTEVKSSEALVVLLDIDGDGIPNMDDPDDDNDGISDDDERRGGTNPLVKDAPPKSQVAGVSTSTTSDILALTGDAAQSLGSSLFDRSENLRKKGGAYVGNKLMEWQAATGTATSSKDIDWWWSGLKLYGLHILSFFLNNIYAFYIALIFIVLWIIRKIWRRYSID